MKSSSAYFLAAIVAVVLFQQAAAKEIHVEDNRGMRAALEQMVAGDVLSIAAGEYRGGWRSAHLRGEKDAQVTIRAADSENPPRFKGGGSSAFHFSSCRHLVLRNLVCDGFSGNGINIDDGSDLSSPSEHILLDGLRIENTGPKGNRDALKLSGVYQFVVKNCHFAGWGGSGIDMVGCHRGVIVGNHFEGREGFSQSNAVQMKGGSSQLQVRDCFFEHVGQRAINLGGS